MDHGDGLPETLDEEPLPASLEAALLEAAANLSGLVPRRAGRRFEFVVGSRIVATLEGGGAEYRLDPAVVAAALRTPDTRPVPGALDRIVFEPRILDRYAADRAVAWLRSAVRRAA
jgi:hypothetical protein